MAAFLLSLSFVLLAEMGDKTQLLAMAFAPRYKAATVLWAVFSPSLITCLPWLSGTLTHFISIHNIASGHSNSGAMQMLYENRQV